MSSGNQPATRMASPLSLPMLAAIVLGLLAIGSSIWAVRSHGQVEDVNRELAELRTNANASVFTLEPTEYAPNSIQGQVYISMSGTGAVVVSNLPQPGDNEEFRLWYLQDDDSTVAGGTLSTDELGQGFALIPRDSGDYTRIAVSLETLGNETSAGNFLLVADVRSGRG